nr:hypothetical protein [Acidimicrobiia bacterium]
ARPCPAGQTKAHAIYSRTPNRLLTGYADLPSAPDGQRWNLESANSDYACYTLVEKTDKTMPWSAVASGIKRVVIGVLEREGERQIAETEAAMAGGRVLHVVVCADATQIAAGLGGSTQTLWAAKRAKDMQAALKKNGYTALAVTVVVVTCEYGPEPSWPDDDNAEPTAEPTATATATATPDDNDNGDDTADPNAPPADYSERSCLTFGHRVFCYYKTPRRLGYPRRDTKRLAAPATGQPRPPRRFLFRRGGPRAASDGLPGGDKQVTDEPNRPENACSGRYS